MALARAISFAQRCAGVDVLVLTSGAFLLDFAILRGAVDADVEDCATLERREK